jgi:hypothetical protein
MADTMDVYEGEVIMIMGEAVDLPATRVSRKMWTQEDGSMKG